MDDIHHLTGKNGSPTADQIEDGKRHQKKNKKVVKDWELYIGDVSLDENWERFLHDLGLGDFKSKSQCKKVLQGHWVNIRDFLTLVQQRNTAAETIDNVEERDAARKTPVQVHFFPNQIELSKYTIRSKKIFPRKAITPESPLRLLLARIL